MTVKELIETLKTCDEKSEVKVEYWNSTVSPMEEVVNDLWTHLGFVLQWAKYGLKK